MTRVRSFRSSLQLQLCMRARSCTAWLSAILTSSNLLRLPASIRADLPRTLTRLIVSSPAFGILFPCNEWRAMSMRQKQFILLSSSALMLVCLAQAAVAQAPEPAPPTSTPPQAPAAPSQTPPTQTPPAQPPAQQSPSTTPAPEGAPAAPGTVPVPTVTVTPPPTPSPTPRAPAPRQPAISPSPAPERAVRAPAPPQRETSPSAPTPGAETPTERFDAERNNIFAPLGTAPTT